jgi:putative alpha-1,2-mannosidase
VGRGAPDHGSVGYYIAQTAQSVIVELAASAHAGMYQYTFPNESTLNNILVDVSHVLPSFRTSEARGLGQGYEGGDLTSSKTATMKPQEYTIWDGIDRQTGQYTHVSGYQSASK